MTRLLSLFGLMKRSEHERDVAYFQNMEKAAIETAELWEGRYKRSIVDLEKQAVEIAQMKVDMSRAAEAADNYLNWIAGLEAEVKALRPDAEAMRRKRQMDRDRRRRGK